MRDTELYEQLLGLTAPWRVARVDLKVVDQRVDVYAEHTTKKPWRCPECGKPCGLHDHEAERVWRHLDSLQFQTFLHARIPRIRCEEHGVRQIRVPWAEPRSRFTALFETFAITVLQHTDVRGAARILRVSWDEAHGIMERAVARGLLRRKLEVPTRLGVDEKALAPRHRYATILVDLAAPRGAHVVELAEGRSKESLLRCLGTFSLTQLERVEAVAMDMWEPYAQVVRRFIGGEKIVFDRFHIMMHMNRAVDHVRRHENRTLRADGDNSLVGSKHLWLYGRENIPDRHTERFSELQAANLRTARAWAIKEMLRDLWDRSSLGAAKRWYSRWRKWASRCNLSPVVKAREPSIGICPMVLTYFTHRVTNAASEAINSTIQMIKKRAYGFRSFSNFRTAVLFRCGGLNLYPVLQCHPKPG